MAPQRNEKRARHASPLLSICIPTYNRAALLASALNSLAPQINAHQPHVELIVCDNASTDHTRDVVERWQDTTAIRYYRNDENIGFYGNLFRITDELAQGEFAWIIGDDDLVRPDGIERVLNVLRQHPDVDYVYVNATPLKHVERLNKGDLISGEDFPDLHPLKSPNMTECVVERWEELIDPVIDDVFLGAAMLSVFRLSRWQDAKASIPIDPAQNHRLDYFNTQILAQAYKGRKAYYLGYPCTIVFSGAQDWVSFRPIVVLVLLQDLLDNYLKHGVDPSRIEMCRTDLLNRSVEAFRVILSRREIPQRQQFSMRKFLWRNRKQNLWAFFRKVFEPSISLLDDSVQDYALPPSAQVTPNGKDVPMVSVVIEAVPGEVEQLQATMQSVLDCGYARCEIIVVDAGLSDSLYDAVRFPSGNVRYFRQGFENAAAALNYGIAQARGEFVAFAQVGDVFLPDKLDAQVRFFRLYPQIGLCYSAFVKIGVSVGAHGGAPLPGDMYVKTNELAGRCYYHLLSYEPMIDTSTVLTPKQVLQDMGGFDESLGQNYDVDLWLRIAKQYEITMTTQPLVRIIARELRAELGFAKLYNLLLWKKIFRGDRNIGWRYRRKRYALLYLNAVRELYQHWHNLPVSRQTAARMALLAVFYNPGAIAYGEVTGVLARGFFPQGLYARLRPMWRRWLGVRG